MVLKLGSAMLILLYITSGDGQCTCPKQYAPVCGSDGAVYLNRCLLNCTKDILKSDLEVMNEGPCNKAAQCQCVLNFSPVCGTDGVTYSNICLLRCERLKNPSLEVREQGPCGRRKKRTLPYENRYNSHRVSVIPCNFTNFSSG